MSTPSRPQDARTGLFAHLEDVTQHVLEVGTEIADFADDLASKSLKVFRHLNSPATKVKVKKSAVAENWPLTDPDTIKEYVYRRADFNLAVLGDLAVLEFFNLDQRPPKKAPISSVAVSYDDLQATYGKAASKRSQQERQAATAAGMYVRDLTEWTKGMVEQDELITTVVNFPGGPYVYTDIFPDTNEGNRYVDEVLTNPNKHILASEQFEYIESRVLLGGKTALVQPIVGEYHRMWGSN